MSRPLSVPTISRAELGSGCWVLMPTFCAKMLGPHESSIADNASLPKVSLSFWLLNSCKSNVLMLLADNVKFIKAKIVRNSEE